MRNLVVMVLLVLMGCDESESKESPVNYTVEVRPPSPSGAEAAKLDSMARLVETRDKFQYLDGATLVANGEPVGTLDSKGEALRAAFELPSRSTVRDTGDSLKLRLPTVCGHYDVALEPEIPDRVVDAVRDGELSQVAIEVDLRLPELRSGYVYIDPGTEPTEETLRIGSLDVPKNTARAWVIAEGCEGAHPVRLGDEEFGTWDIREATLVSFDASACHGFFRLGPKRERIPVASFRQEHVRPLPGLPDEFLAPDFRPKAGKTSLQRIPCAEEAGEAP